MSVDVSDTPHAPQRQDGARTAFPETAADASAHPADRDPALCPCGSATCGTGMCRGRSAGRLSPPHPPARDQGAASKLLAGAFSDGKKAKNGLVTVYGANGDLLATGTFSPEPPASDAAVVHGASRGKDAASTSRATAVLRLSPA
ncbi:hypothetical protein ACIO3O_00840 [Streptomyces sp. NPDC087440]|uniref:hypothetical protein n=1 Tax=Streptomyces sp. NPDC087440 TaxID=3365790 RepID=UPI00382503C0